MLAPRRDVDAIVAGLARWLAARRPGARDVQVAGLRKPSAGVSNETFLFDAVWSDGTREPLVARLMPSGPPVFPEYDLAKQYRVMERLAATGVPVPPLVGFEADPAFVGGPFYVMARLDGQIPSEVPPYHAYGHCLALPVERRRRMWWSGIETLARIHAVDWRRAGLDFLDVDGQLEYWARYFAWARDDRPQPILDAALDWLRRHRPAPSRLALCWGDSRLPNLIFRDEEVAAVLDWEMAFVGDPAHDLAWWLFLDWSHSEGYGIPRLEGLPGREETVARYEALAGRRVEHLFWHEVMAAFRYGVITVRVGRNMLDLGLPLANEEMLVNNPCTQWLARALDLPPPGAARAVTPLSAVRATVQFRLTGPGARAWYVVAEDGTGARHDGTAPHPDVVFTMAAADWAALQRGELNRTEAFLGGKIVIEGDMTLLLQLEELLSRLNAEA